LLFACRELSSGKVIDKHFEPGYYTTEMHTYGKTTIPEMVYHSPSYILRMQGYDKKGKLISEYWYVSSGIFEKYKIGDTIKDTATDY
jgi:hypothetical protein